jgi:hypothetical protein
MNESLETEAIDWSSVVVIGEYTTSLGPLGDDQFLVIVLRSGEWAAYSAAGAEAAKAIPSLEAATGAKVKFGLSNVTTEASRVIFPPVLAEHPLLVFGQPEKGFHALLKRVQRMGIVEISMDLTEEVQNYIRSIEETQSVS